MGERRAAGLSQRSLTGVLDAVLAVTLAPQCVSCRRPLDRPTLGPVCPACWASITPVPPPCCRLCGESLPSWRIISIASSLCARCRRTPTHVDAGVSAGAYDGALRDIIHAFKYEGRRTLSHPLGAMLRAASADVLKGVDCVVPVPLHPWRRLTRGFNQAADLAARLGPPVVHALWRRRATAPQTGLHAAARRRNLHDAIGLSPLLGHRAFDRHVRRRIVLVVDDVRTTGATLEACARALKAGGANEVRTATVATARAAR